MLESLFRSRDARGPADARERPHPSSFPCACADAEIFVDTFRGAATIEYEETRQAGRQGKASGQIVHFRVGERSFIDADYKGRLPHAYVAANHVLYLSAASMARLHKSMLRYSALAVAAASTVDARDAVVLDLGAGSGIQGIHLKGRGARKVLCVDNEWFWRRHIAENLEANRLSPEDFPLYDKDIDRSSVLAAALPLDDISVVIENMGPHYDPTYLRGIRLLRHMPNAKVFIGGGFIKGDEKYTPARALEALHALGFTRDYRELISSEWGLPRMAFAVERA